MLDEAITLNHIEIGLFKVEIYKNQKKFHLKDIEQLIERLLDKEMLFDYYER
jgi:hypothetical protein